MVLNTGKSNMIKKKYKIMEVKRKTKDITIIKPQKCDLNENKIRQTKSAHSIFIKLIPLPFSLLLLLFSSLKYISS